MTTKSDILDFWFGLLTQPTDFPEERFKLWFVKDKKVDEETRLKFGPLIEENLDEWSFDPTGRPAQIIVL